MTQHEKGEPEMSAHKRRNILIGFGGAAVVAAAVAFLSPNFPYRSEDASGAIGAVQKHRAPQIKQTDVVLGDEQTKKDQQVLYTDFVNDAAVLQNVSAELQAAAGSMDARRIVAAQQTLEARNAELKGRVLANAESALAAMDQLGKATRNSLAQQSHAELAKMVQDLKNAEQLSAQDLDQLSGRMMAASPQLTDGKLRAQALEAMSSDLSAVSRLNQAIDNEALAARIRAQAEYLAAMAKESKVLEAASNSLQAKSYDAKMLGRMSSQLLQAAEQLQVRAVANMEQSLASYSDVAESLGKANQILMSAEQSLGSQELAAARRQLGAKDAELMARAKANSEASQALAVRLNSASQLNQRALASAMSDTQQLAQRASDLLAARQRQQ
jgi:hypothetical protein